MFSFFFKVFKYISTLVLTVLKTSVIVQIEQRKGDMTYDDA